MRYRVERMAIGVPMQFEVAQSRSTTEQILATAQAMKEKALLLDTRMSSGLSPVSTSARGH